MLYVAAGCAGMREFTIEVTPLPVPVALMTISGSSEC
jgi:hypothetical protein